MKKKLVMILMCSAALMAAACTNTQQEEAPVSNEESSDAVEEDEEEPQEDETETEETLVVAKPTYYLNNYDSSDEGTTINYWAEGLTVLNDGWDNIKSAFDNYNADVKATLDSEYESALESAEEYGMDDEEWAYESRVIFERADEVVVSFYRGTYMYLGGAHPSYLLSGYNYDSKSGQKLDIKDVVNDYDELYGEVRDYLNESDYQADGELYEDWENTVYAYFYDDSYDLVWTFTNDGLEISFNPYELAPYAAGMIVVDLPYDEYGNNIREEYIKEDVQMCKEISAYQDYEVDLDNDGTNEKVRIETGDDYENDNSFELSVVVTVNGSGRTVLRDESNEFSRAFIVENAEGKYYIYADIISDNDYHFLEVFDISDVEGGPFYAGCSEAGAVYGGMILDAEHFILYNKLDVLGSYTGYRECYVGQDGMPVSYTDEYNIVNYVDVFGEEDYMNRYITLKEEVEVDISEDSTFKNESKETLTVGEQLYPYATDGISYMIFKLSDGRYIRMEIEKDEESYSFSINGIDEYEMFEGILYAG